MAAAEAAFAPREEIVGAEGDSDSESGEEEATVTVESDLPDGGTPEAADTTPPTE